MKAFVLTETAGPESAVVRNEPRPELAAGSVRVALKAASLNHRELWISRGLYPGMKLPCVMGADGAGVVTEVGDGVDQALVGREVVLYPGDGWGDNRRFPARGFAMLGMPLPGTIAEEICVPATTVFAKPAHLSFEQAAALPTAGITAWRGLTEKAALQSGEILLVTGVGGGVATFALIFGRALGAEVYVTSGSDTTLARAGALGAAGGFNYREPGWRKALQEASRGLDVVFDGAPAAGLSEYTRALRAGARVVIYGSTGGPVMTMAAPDLFLRHATISGTAMGDLVDFAAMLAFITAHRLEPVIDRTFAIDQSREALLYLERGHAFGKVVIAI
ncbi:MULTISPECIES: NAD(P)-dependent alcohol dehydrogenase [unclassified Chelatococcus]|uniref:zinc-dependent alcohol dehydrogenase family protein n=1 Tax=unclassified Chelatococcus TaxID=2638111 RepID=UPI001BD092A8|nr:MULTISPECIES: NAD(P)-dependent alcohol dehydrogenase [unclassified Chelatococcus]CAH1652863.1 Alcohol dehydrogenase [Hyphomicrobiales bacterium]MBS7742977.1 NAD(P)-dependent alcohol dehydrogenase [Chelatococcus sp. HY11]MBX3541905.1 NAD(P)-dependent alcohol dehydrogenase [Chelatococcus sp.]MCO5074204.1 NAD(P)-dependent alcohol dehydrogenase [Chelatococcus sp.]CAH1694093.1 Alcohol dehydrogenase [Hyphomicrobiales bacterium]